MHASPHTRTGLWLGVALSIAGCSSSAVPVPADLPEPTGQLRVLLEHLDDDLPAGTFSFRLDQSSALTTLDRHVPVTLELPVGPHALTLVTPDPGCRDVASPHRETSVAANQVVDVVFRVSCAGRFGSVRVTVHTVGVEPDPDGYTIRVGSGDPRPVAPTGDLVIDRLLPGPVAVHQLGGLAPNCAAQDALTGRVMPVPSWPATVLPGREVTLAITIGCHPTARNTILAHDKVHRTLVTIRPDGTGIGTLELGPGYVGGDYALSPDGTRLAVAYASTGVTPIGPGYRGIRIMFLDGTVIAETFPDRNDLIRPKWSRDNRLIVAGSRTGQVVVTGADGIGQRAVRSGYDPDLFSALGPLLYTGPCTQLAHGLDQPSSWLAPLCGAYPTWSPDGTQLAHTCRDPALESEHQLCVSTLGGTTRILTSGPLLHAFPAWSSDGTQLVYYNEAGIHVIAVDGSGEPGWLPLPPGTVMPQWSW